MTRRRGGNRNNSGAPRRGGQGQRQLYTAAPLDEGVVELTFSSGYTAALRRLPYRTVQLLRQKEAEQFPIDDPPTQVVQTELGEKRVPFSIESPEGAAYLTKLEQVAMQRAAFRLDYILGRFLVITGGEDEQGRNGIIRAHRAEIDDVKALDPSLDDWDVFVRHVAIRSATDYRMLMKNAEALTTAVSDEEIAAAASSFRGDVQRDPDPGSQAPGGQQ